ncbi:MAG: hypothetical protein KGM97_00375 [Alphaproteobacteria bacterium]|nr:hypothetical protein [Alphaproteobacteria bacterium]MDE2629419.1 hypothetical protein [Alphaproteobacteria bacterium]
MRKFLPTLLRVDMTWSVPLCAALLLVALNDSRAGTMDSAWRSYTDAKYGFSISYPLGWKLDAKHVYDALGPGKGIPGVAFVIPASMANGTNLSSDSYIAVELMPAAPVCDFGRFLDYTDKSFAMTDAGRRYSYAEVGEGAAGNYYEQRIYALTDSRPCIGVRTFIHSTNIDNYDPGTVRQFDRKALLAQFDRIRRTLVLRPRAPAPAAPR